MDNKQKLKHARIALQFLQRAVDELIYSSKPRSDPDYDLWRAGEELKLINGADDDLSGADERLFLRTL